MKSAGQSEILTFKGSLGSDAHGLAVSFLNEAYGGTPTAERNLYVNGASYNRITFPPAAAALDAKGTTHFTSQTVADPGSADGLTSTAQNSANPMQLTMPAHIRS